MDGTAGLDLPTGTVAVRLARRAVETATGPALPDDAARLLEGLALPSIFDEPRGAFTTLKLHPSGRLRGCIGFPLPAFPLGVAVARSAAAAATEDPRFPPVSSEEAGRLTVEVSILTPPERLPARRPRDRVQDVRVGRDGLVVRWGGADGLLLPQVALEERWGAEEFLAETCLKAGLPADAWLRPDAQVFRFGSTVFAERSPRGPVRAVPLGGDAPTA